MKKHGVVVLFVAALAIFSGGDTHGQSSLCTNLDMKPVLSLDQINQADLVDYLVETDPNLERPSGPEIDSPEALYEAEVQLLLDNGYPPVFGEVEPGHVVTRRYFASVMFEVAVQTDDAFAMKYGGLTDETDRVQALVDSDWMYAEEGNLYREEVLSVLCNKTPSAPGPPALDIVPEMIMDAELEGPRSGI